jgi:hypothetical protein
LSAASQSSFSMPNVAPLLFLLLLFFFGGIVQFPIWFLT